MADIVANSHRARPDGKAFSDPLASGLKSLRGTFIGVGAFSAVSNLLMLAGPLFMLEIYDRVLPSGSITTLALVSLLVVALYAVQAGIDIIRSRVLSRTGAILEEGIGSRVFRTLIRLGVRRGPSEAMQPVRDLDSIRSFLSGLGPTAFFDLPWIPFYIAIIYAFHPLLGLTALAGALFLAAFTFASERLIRRAAKEGKEHSEQRLAFAEAGGRNAETLVTMGLAARMGARWQALSRANLASVQRTGDVSGNFGNAAKAFRLALQSGVLAVGAWLVIREEASAGAIIAASILTARALAPVDLAIAHWKGFVGARQGWQRLRDLFEALPDEEDRIDLPRPHKSLSVESVSIVSPSGNRIVAQNVGFTLAAGQALGVVGASASGKSSLARVLTGVWPAVRGAVRLDGAALDQWPEESRGRDIGYLPQAVELFAGTVAQNIARFAPDASDEAVIAAARAAGAHELIVALPEGYATQVGQDGANLSAGQQQRIALARALYGDPFLVVLDEPNSNLDAEGEGALTQAIAGIRQRGGIAIVIAHRPSALAATDMTLVMRQGRVEQFGPKEEILRNLLRPASADRSLVPAAVAR